MTPAEWSRAVRERDGACVDCGATELLHAHHVKPKSTHPELRFELSNGVAVCPTCHARRHRGEGAVRIQAKKRRPHRKTLELKIEQLEARISALEERALGAEREAGRLMAENVKLKKVVPLPYQKRLLQ